MNKKYTLKDLVLFWQRQTRDSYCVIEAIINLIEYDSETLTDDKKTKIIIDTLRKYGLFEVGYKGDRNFSEKREIYFHEEPIPEEKVDWDQNVQDVQIELYNIELLNTIVEFQEFMN